MTNPRESAYGEFGGIDSGPHCIPVVSATGITPFVPLPPSCMILPFHSVGRLTWKLIFGAAGSTGAIAPITLQYSGIARTTPVPWAFRVCADAGTITADVIVAPEVGRPMADAAI